MLLSVYLSTSKHFMLVSIVIVIARRGNQEREGGGEETPYIVDESWEGNIISCDVCCPVIN